jgi:hypothetical protein
MEIIMNFTVTPYDKGFMLTHHEAGNPSKYFGNKDEVQAYINELVPPTQTFTLTEAELADLAYVLSHTIRQTRNTNPTVFALAGELFHKFNLGE